MNITNTRDLPQPLVDAVSGFQASYLKGHYRPSDISVTSLIGPPQLETLKRKKGHELTEDASERIFALFGSAVHSILEHCEIGETETRLYLDCENWTISGQFDWYHEEILSDYKVCSVWESIYGLKPERIAQMNVLAYLCEENDRPVKEAQIVAIHRDWSLSKSEREADYPPQVKVHKVPLWPLSERLTYIAERVCLHKAAREGVNIPCTEEERWHKPDKWAVMKEGRKSALRVLDSEEEAVNWSLANGAAERDDLGNPYMRLRHSVEHRPGEDTRCESYCPVASICPQRNP